MRMVMEHSQRIARHGTKAGPALLTLALLFGSATAQAVEENAGTTSPTAEVETRAQSGVVARVNGEAIGQDELEWAANAWLRSQDMDLGGVRNPGAYRDIERRVLERLIQEELILQAARDQGMEVPQAMLDERMRADQARFDSPEAFATQLESFDLTLEEHRQRTRRQLLLEEYVRRQVEPQVAVDDAEIDRVYADYVASEPQEELSEAQARRLIRSELEQRQLARRISEHLQALRDDSEVQVSLR